MPVPVWRRAILSIHPVSSHHETALTAADLHEICARNPSPDVLALAWEIKRLRAIVLYADQLQKMLGPMSGPAGMVRDALRGQLETEPCVLEMPKLDPMA
jgi:hypothetical protein